MGSDTVVDRKHCAPHIATVMNGSPHGVGMSVLKKVEYDRVPLLVYPTAHERNKTQSISWNGGIGRIVSQIAKLRGTTWGPPGSYRPQMGPMLALWILLSGCVFWSLRILNRSGRIADHRAQKLCQIGLRGNIHNCLCFVIFLIQNLVRGEYGKYVCCLVGFNRGVFVLQTVYLYGFEQSISMILQVKLTSHFISYTDFGHTLKNANCTKRHGIWQTVS